MGTLFGTDGIRGVANEYPMTAEMAVRVGRAVATVFRDQVESRKSLSAGTPGCPDKCWNLQWLPVSARRAAMHI